MKVPISALESSLEFLLGLIIENLGGEVLVRWCKEARMKHVCDRYACILGGTPAIPQSDCILRQ
jgi:hypothetical protein